MKFLKSNFDFLKSVSLYLVSIILNKSVPLILLPILAAYISIEEYGTLSYYQVLISFVSPIIGLNMSTVLSKYFFKKNEKEFSLLLINVIYVSLLAFITLISFISIMDVFFNIFNEMIIPVQWIYFLPILAFVISINEYNTTLLRFEKKPVKYAFYEISRGGLDFVVTILLVVVYLFGWEGRLYGVLLSAIIICVISIFRIVKKYKITISKINKKLIKDILLIALPLIPHAYGSVIISLFDRLLIEQYLGVKSLGLYTVSYQVASLILFITVAINRLWSPWIYEKLSIYEEKGKNTIVKFSYVVITLLIFMVFLIYLGAKYVLPYLFPGEYLTSNNLIVVISLSFVFYAMYTMIFPLLIHFGKSKFLGISSGLGAIVNVCLNIILIPKYGIMGAAISTMFSYFCIFLVVLIYSNTLIKLPWLNFTDNED